MYCREINLRIISFAIYFWLIFPQAWIYAFHHSSTLERNGVNFNTSAIFACKIFKIVSAEAMGSSGGHLFKETSNNGSLAIKIKMEITFWMQEANEYCIYNTLAFSMYEPLLNSCILEILKPGCLLKNADSSFSFYANVKRWRRIPVCWNKWISMWMGHIGLVPLETAAFKVQSRIKISYCDFSLFRSPNHVTFSALIGFEPVPHWLEVLSFLLIAIIYKSCNQWNNCFLSPFLILLLGLTFSFQDWWLWKHLRSKNVNGRPAWTLSFLIKSFFFPEDCTSGLPERFAFSADVLLANKMGLQQYIAEDAGLQWHRRISAAKGRDLGRSFQECFQHLGD